MGNPEDSGLENDRGNDRHEMKYQEMSRAVQWRFIGIQNVGPDG